MADMSSRIGSFIGGGDNVHVRCQHDRVKVRVGSFPGIEQGVVADHFPFEVFLNLGVEGADQIMQTLEGGSGQPDRGVNVVDRFHLDRQTDMLGDLFTVDLCQRVGFRIVGAIGYWAVRTRMIVMNATMMNSKRIKIMLNGGVIGSSQN